MAVKVRGCLISVDGGGNLIKMRVPRWGWYGCIGNKFIYFFLKCDSQDLEFVLGTVSHSSCLSRDLPGVKLAGPLHSLSFCVLAHTVSRIFLRTIAEPTTKELRPPLRSSVLLLCPVHLARGGFNLLYSGSSQVFK